MTRLSSIRLLFVVVLGCTLLTSVGDTASGQPPPIPGTVTWAQGYPKITNSVPPNMFGTITAYGDYTEKIGWKAQNTGFYWVPQAGGVPQSTPLDIKGGKWGGTLNGNIFERNVTVSQGKYNVWTAIIYADANMPPNQVAVLSAIYSLEVK